MWRKTSSTWAAMLCIALVAACTPQPTPAPTSDTPRPGHASVFFPTTVDTYRLALPPAERDRLAELYALRQIDPCGLVDQKTLAANGYRDYSYTYRANSWIEPGASSPIMPLGGDGCTIAFPSTQVGLLLEIKPGERRGTDDQYTPDTRHPHVMTRSSSACEFRTELPLIQLAGAPTSMRNPMVELSPIRISDGTWTFDDTSLCGLSGAIAADIAANIEQRGVPAHADAASPAARFLTSDPCAAAVDLGATGFDWREPNPQAQWPTTWRHPGVCSLTLPSADSGRPPARAVIRYGLVQWSDALLLTPWGRDPQRSTANEAHLFSYSAGQDECFVIARLNRDFTPITVGEGAAVLVPPTPIVTVQLNRVDNSQCADTARQVATSAAARAI